MFASDDLLSREVDEKGHYAHIRPAHIYILFTRIHCTLFLHTFIHTYIVHM